MFCFFVLYLHCTHFVTFLLFIPDIIDSKSFYGRKIAPIPDDCEDCLHKAQTVIIQVKYPVFLVTHQMNCLQNLFKVMLQMIVKPAKKIIQKQQLILHA